jgi:hypothetical protein
MRDLDRHLEGIEVVCPHLAVPEAEGGDVAAALRLAVPGEVLERHRDMLRIDGPALPWRPKTAAIPMRETRYGSSP